MAQILYEVKDRLAYGTLNRPEKMNAINHETSERIFSLFARMERDPEVWECLITGAGEVFSSGHDLTDEIPEGREVKPVSDLYQVVMEFYKPWLRPLSPVHRRVHRRARRPADWPGERAAGGARHQEDHRQRDMTMEDALGFGDVILQRLLEIEDAEERAYGRSMRKDRLASRESKSSFVPYYHRRGCRGEV